MSTELRDMPRDNHELSYYSRQALQT